jgi:hypothetical protein
MIHGAKTIDSCELIIDQLVRFIVVELTHSGLSSRLGMGARIPRFILGFNDAMLLVIGDVPVDNKTLVVTS